jgi:hypothetical protein
MKPEDQAEMNAAATPVDTDPKRNTRNDIQNWFTYHPPKGDQATRYEIIREEFRALGLVIVDLTPCCPDQTAALRKLRECSMAVNQIIACNE